MVQWRGLLGQTDIPHRRETSQIPRGETKEKMLERVGCEKLWVKREDREEEWDRCQGDEKRGRRNAVLWLWVHFFDGFVQRGLGVKDITPVSCTATKYPIVEYFVA